MVLIDNHKPAVENIRNILQHWQKQDAGIAQVRALADDALKVLAQFAEQNIYFDVIFLDPPFGQDWLARTLPLIAPLCVEDTLLYVEVEKGFDWMMLSQFGWACVREGKTQQTLYGLWKRQ